MSSTSREARGAVGAGAATDAAHVFSKEILAQVRRIDLRTRGLVESLFSGEYRSVFKGRGLELLDLREYQPGDDVRSIDWNVTAPAGLAVRERVCRGARAERADRRRPVGFEAVRHRACGELAHRF